MSQKSTTPPSAVWNINGNEFFIDMGDVSAQQRFEKALENLKKNEKVLPKTGLNSERTLAFCNMFRAFFDDIFGEGASQKIFGDVNNARIMTETYEQFLEFVQKQGELFQQTNNRVLNRFSPNRAQRRAQAKGKQG